jgi:hypothetical protein
MGGYQALAPMPDVLIDVAIVRVCILLRVGVASSSNDSSVGSLTSDEQRPNLLPVRKAGWIT